MTYWAVSQKNHQEMLMVIKQKVARSVILDPRLETFRSKSRLREKHIGTSKSSIVDDYAYV